MPFNQWAVDQRLLPLFPQQSSIWAALLAIDIQISRCRISSKNRGDFVSEHTGGRAPLLSGIWHRLEQTHTATSWNWSGVRSGQDPALWRSNNMKLSAKIQRCSAAFREHWDLPATSAWMWDKETKRVFHPVLELILFLTWIKLERLTVTYLTCYFKLPAHSHIQLWSAVMWTWGCQAASWLSGGPACYPRPSATLSRGNISGLSPDSLCECLSLFSPYFPLQWVCLITNQTTFLQMFNKNETICSGFDLVLHLGL